jgi:hypothetical protein
VSQVFNVTSEMYEHSADVRYNVSGAPVIKTNQGMRLRPDRIEFVYIDGRIWTVTISGPGLLKNNQPASRRGKAVFGVGGWRLSDLYDWAAVLMMQADKYNVEG